MKPPKKREFFCYKSEKKSISVLFSLLIHRYMELGLDFMKRFYSTGNKPLSACLGEVEGVFPKGTVMGGMKPICFLQKRRG